MGKWLASLFDVDKDQQPQPVITFLGIMEDYTTDEEETILVYSKAGREQAITSRLYDVLGCNALSRTGARTL